jgi:hypothetical protein
MSSVEKIILCEKPQMLYVDEYDSAPAPEYCPVSSLIESLQKQGGPFAAAGKFGPAAHNTESMFKLRAKVANQDVYGFQPNTFKESALSIRVIVLGARVTGDKSFVYYLIAEEQTEAQAGSKIKRYRPSKLDQNIYIVSYKNFLERLKGCYAFCPSGEWLFSVKPESMIDGDSEEARCKCIGQKIFSRYKRAAQGDSVAGIKAMQRICNAALVLTADGQLRKACIERAWDGIGDVFLRWRS